MVSLANSHTHATRIGWHLWEIDLRFATGLPPGWILCFLAMVVHVVVVVVVVVAVGAFEPFEAATSPPPTCCTHSWSVAKQLCENLLITRPA